MRYGLRARHANWPPLRLARLRFERESVVVVCPLALHLTVDSKRRKQVRSIGLDVHQSFCEVAICEAGEVRSAGRIRSHREELELFAQSLGATDQVVMEVTGPAMEIARILEPHVARVVVANAQEVRAISLDARVKSDRFDARTLARLLAAGMLDPVWVPDPATQALRGGEWPAVPPWCASAPGLRTRSMWCSPAAC